MYSIEPFCRVGAAEAAVGICRFVSVAVIRSHILSLRTAASFFFYRYREQLSRADDFVSRNQRV